MQWLALRAIHFIHQFGEFLMYKQEQQLQTAQRHLEAEIKALAKHERAAADSHQSSARRRQSLLQVANGSERIKELQARIYTLSSIINRAPEPTPEEMQMHCEPYEYSFAEAEKTVIEYADLEEKYKRAIHNTVKFREFAEQTDDPINRAKRGLITAHWQERAQKIEERISELMQSHPELLGASGSHRGQRTPQTH